MGVLAVTRNELAAMAREHARAILQSMRGTREDEYSHYCFVCCVTSLSLAISTLMVSKKETRGGENNKPAARCREVAEGLRLALRPLRHTQHTNLVSVSECGHAYACAGLRHC